MAQTDIVFPSEKNRLMFKQNITIPKKKIHYKKRSKIWKNQQLPVLIVSKLKKLLKSEKNLLC